jgi:hypothetical protein
MIQETEYRRNGRDAVPAVLFCLLHKNLIPRERMYVLWDSSFDTIILSEIPELSYTDIRPQTGAERRLS